MKGVKVVLRHDLIVLIQGDAIAHLLPAADDAVVTHSMTCDEVERVPPNSGFDALFVDESTEQEISVHGSLPRVAGT